MRYIVFEWEKDAINPLSHNMFSTNDISEFISDEIGIGNYPYGDILIIDTLEHKVINSYDCEWEDID